MVLLDLEDGECAALELSGCSQGRVHAAGGLYEGLGLYQGCSDELWGIAGVLLELWISWIDVSVW